MVKICPSSRINSSENNTCEYQMALSEHTDRDISRSTKSNADDSVIAVVAKAKRAASSLWMLIHAQGCRFGGTSCPHRGCADAKRLLLHIKTCVAGPDFMCPEDYNGCHQARKLLLHYRRCREIRARQRQSRSGRQQSHSCLVCSLVARHARIVLEGGKGPTTTMQCVAVGTSQNLQNQISLQKVGNLTSSLNSSTIDEEKPFESPSKNTVPKGRLNVNQTQHFQSSPLTRSDSMGTMPPPAPRPRTSSLGSVPLSYNSTYKSKRILPLLTEEGNPENCAYESPEYGSPPSSPQLMHQGVSAVAAAAAPLPLSGRNSNPSLLSKSVDSSRCSFMKYGVAKSTVRDNMDTSETMHGDVLMTSPSPVSEYRRPRAESFDDRKKKHIDCLPSIPSSSSTPEFGIDEFPSDSNANIRKMHEEEQLAQFEMEQDNAPPVSSGTVIRRRSMSCGILTSLGNPVGCETITEDISEDQHHDHYRRPMLDNR